MKKFSKNLLNASLALCMCGALILSTQISAANETVERAAIELKENQFVTLTFHDVRDDVENQTDRDMYAISTKNLAQYLAWIKKEGWKPIRLEDVWAARQKQQILPERAVLLTFDDGALSSYSKVYPLLKQYNIPAVFAIPTSWINGNTQAGYEAYGQGNLMNWNQMREMQKSGLVEFVSHSNDLHKGIQANPQKNMEPAAIVREYFPQLNRYETDAEYKTRVVDDLKKSKQVLDHELGIDTKAIFWPYGAVTPEAEEFAKQAGLPMSFSLGSVVSLADSVRTYQRSLIMNNPEPEQIHQDMNDFIINSKAPYKQRKSFVRMNASELVSSSLAESEERLGNLLNQVQALKTSHLLVPAVADTDADGQYDLAFFPNTQIKQQQDVLNRLVWQTRTRIGNRVYAELPVQLELKQGISLATLTADLLKNNTSLEGLVIDTQDQLACAVEKANWDASCEQQLQQVLRIKEQSKNQAKYYANISNDYQTALKLELKTSHLDGLSALLNRSMKSSDFMYINVDPIQHPQTIPALLKQIKTLSPQQMQRLIVSLNVQQEMSAKDWKVYQQAYQKLRSLSIQKIGINNYQLSKGQVIQQQLYSSLSMNDSTLTYRNPYNNEVKK
ncbi:poly-beta-1,6-N-acetyl-D-glucosamine N-deacetylase PgaB [uncultured Acinetobacter sp.]|uniref:poly-beta-1,6-N-acetyl-D-glucosamine N-deacetylase PgaB n=1 Tax=uncultured Acinetobacter sp. TaxID=165433 RepID=UPI0025940277|nr:poly-beta-1,6-N-acetyl-D-glucosamine N-deacetylase PgaB [uncultured Acinetobacter sp.]